VFKWSSAFNNKHVLLDAMLGWHHEDNAIRSSDGSKVGSGEGLSTVPKVWFDRSSPHSINDLERPSVASDACDRPGMMTLCPVSSYLGGGPGILVEQALDRWQGKATLTGLFTALGHHVVKGGVDVEVMRYHSLFGASGKAIYTEDPASGV